MPAMKAVKAPTAIFPAVRLRRTEGEEAEAGADDDDPPDRDPNLAAGTAEPRNRRRPGRGRRRARRSASTRRRHSDRGACAGGSMPATRSPLRPHPSGGAHRTIAAAARTMTVPIRMIGSRSPRPPPDELETAWISALAGEAAPAVLGRACARVERVGALGAVASARAAAAAPSLHLWDSALTVDAGIGALPDRPPPDPRNRIPPSPSPCRGSRSHRRPAGRRCCVASRAPCGTAVRRSRSGPARRTG